MPHVFEKAGAGEGNRTLVISFEVFKLALISLSYFRFGTVLALIFGGIPRRTMERYDARRARGSAAMKARMVLLVALFSTTPAMADMTGMQLLSFCTSGDRNSTEQLMCAFYIAGVNDGFFGAQVLARKKLVSCIPPDVSAAQARLIAEKHMREHPEKLDDPAAIIVVESLVAAFPCKKQN